MKIFRYLKLCCLLILMSGCGHELGKEEAEAIIKKEIIYPRPILKELYIKDPSEYHTLIKAGLAAQIDTTRAITMADMGKQVIFFRDSQYLVLPRKDDDVQQVKAGKSSFERVVSIDHNDEMTSAKVLFKVVASDPTPFAVLLDPGYFTTDHILPINFIYQDGEWKLKK